MGIYIVIPTTGILYARNTVRVSQVVGYIENIYSYALIQSLEGYRWLLVFVLPT